MVAAFEVTVDTLMALRINASDVTSLFNGISNSSSVPGVISAIVLRCFFDSKCLYRSKDGATHLSARLFLPAAFRQPCHYVNPYFLLWMCLS